jgi:pilus assembly protein CpaF
MVDRLLASTERQLNAKQPLVQARVLDGTARLTAAIPPVSDRLSATLRRYTVRDASLDELVARDALSEEAAAFMWAVMQVRSRIAISGEPGAGKTTLAAALLAAVPASHCVRCCEEIREIAVPVVHGSYYEVRPPGLDGTGEIDMRQLVKFVLAMRPDRIVVGEVRGAEAFELTRAVNAGCGFLCTVHANSAPDALNALVNAALMAGENVTERIVRKVFTEALDLVIQLDRDDHPHAADGRLRRQVMEITAITPTISEDQTCEPIFVRDGLGEPLVWTGALPPGLERRIDRALPDGLSLRALLGGGQVRPA